MIEVIGYAVWLLLNIYLTYKSAIVASIAWDTKSPRWVLMFASLAVIAIASASWYGLYSSPLIAPHIERVL